MQRKQYDYVFCVPEMDIEEKPIEEEIAKTSLGAGDIQLQKKDKKNSTLIFELYLIQFSKTKIVI